MLAVQPQAFVQASAEPLNLLIDACFKVKQQSVIDDLTQTLKTIYTLFPLDKPDNPAQVRAPLQLSSGHLKKLIFMPMSRVKLFASVTADLQFFLVTSWAGVKLRSFYYV